MEVLHNRRDKESTNSSLLLKALLWLRNLAHTGSVEASTKGLEVCICQCSQTMPTECNNIQYTYRDTCNGKKSPTWQNVFVQKCSNVAQTHQWNLLWGWIFTLKLPDDRQWQINKDQLYQEPELWRGKEHSTEQSPCIKQSNWQELAAAELGII